MNRKSLRLIHPSSFQIVVILLGIGLVWVAWFLVGGWQVRHGLAQAKQQVDSGHYGPARDRLAGLSTWWPRRAEVDYLLGECEARLGRPDAALAAWGRVPASSPLAVSANLARARALLRLQGRFIEAEAAYRAAIRSGSGPRAVEARWALAMLLLWEGRLDEVHQVLEEAWRVGQYRDRITALRELWRLDSVVVAAEEVQPLLDQAAVTSPDDDRAWLARAHLAARYGRYAEAREWLDASVCKRPADPVVWRADLEWALAADQPREALRALAGIPPDHVRSPERLIVRAWFAARRNDPKAERLALEQLIEVEPGNTAVLDRLATLAVQAGHLDQATALRKRQEDTLRDKVLYRRLMLDDGAPIAPDELHKRAGLAERLGRWFEAKGWLTLALEHDSGDQLARDALARLARDVRTSSDPPAVETLLDLVGESNDPGPAGTTVPGPPLDGNRSAILFQDHSEAAGLCFTYHNGESAQHQIPETIGGGVAVLDYDGDGWLDVFLVQGGSFPPVPGRPGPGDRLFRNRRDGTFEDVTAATGIARMARGYSFGVTVGDYDNDGRPDLFITRFGSYALLLNQADGTFADVTDRAGLGGDRDWPTSATFADFDGDGDLDLYVCHYLAWDARHPILCTDPRAPSRHVSCVPLGFPALADHLFRNGGGHFVDVTAESGMADHDGRGLGVVAADLDDDGRIDLYVANDMTANYLFRNLGNLKFEEIGHRAGVACNAEGAYQAGMGTACGDLNGDGRPDLAVTNFFGESTTFFQNLGQGLFADATAAVGLKAPSRFLLGFGVTFLDADNDGCLDLATANGHIHDLRPKIPYAMPAQLLTGDLKGRLTDVTKQSGAVWSVPRVGRGLANADLDNDGRVDLLLVAQNSPMVYFHNRTERAGHFLTLRLEGTRSNRDAIGARVTVISGGRHQTAWRIGGGSYASASDPRLHFGLGSQSMVDSIEIRWPSGRLSQFHKLPAGTGYLIREGEPKPRPLNEFARPGAT
jgi:enediyne biosynthesis protein E4